MRPLARQGGDRGRDWRRRQDSGREPLCRPARRLPLHPRRIERRHPRQGHAPCRGEGADRRACRPRRFACRCARRGHHHQGRMGASSGRARRSPGSRRARPRSSRAFSFLPTSISRRSDRERVLKRLDAKLDAELRAKLAPLMALSEASDLSGLARGLAYQLTENLGVLRRDSGVRGDQSARPGGARPAAQIRRAIRRLQRLHPSFAQARGGRSAADAVGAPFRSRARLRCRYAARAPAAGPDLGRGGQVIPEPYWRTAGFHVAGTRAVRIDMLERLSDLIRARIACGAAEGGDAAPTGATGDGGFRVVPELMSVVGCSGEEFARS